MTEQKIFKIPLKFIITNILILGNLSEEDKEDAKRILDKSSKTSFFHDLNDDEKDIALEKTEIVIGGRLTDEQLNKTKHLKMQQIFGTGVNRHNLQFFKENGVLFCNSHAHAFIIAEHGYSMLHSASKNLHTSDELLRKGIWDPQVGTSVSLLNKTVLFLGFGNIAKYFKNFCKPFDMKYLAIKRTEQCDDPEVKVFLPKNKKEALKQADFIFNSLPLTSKTTNFLDKEEFEVMKSNVIIINVGRGGTINDKALYEALKENKIKRAAIDVWYNYPINRGGGDQEQNPIPCYPSDYPFQELDNIIMSAHRAWVSDISFSDFRKELYNNVNRFIRGEPVRNIVNLDEEY